jgi:tRNA(adenine34) deaminase
VSEGRATEQDVEMMRKVVDEAQRAIDIGKAGVGALLLFDGEILALGHNRAEETGDMTAHAEMVVMRDAAFRLGQMSDEEKARITIYSTLEPCLMCTAAISFVGIRRVVYGALTEDFNEEQMIARGITIDKLNPLLTRGPLELVPGVLRDECKTLAEEMGKDS